MGDSPLLSSGQEYIQRGVAWSAPQWYQLGSIRD
jgi:hypothetical protein